VRAHSLRFLISALIAALVLTTVPDASLSGVAPADAAGASTFSQPAEQTVSNEPPADAMSRARTSGERVADRSKWDATSRTFANPDGTWHTEVSQDLVNYRAADGTWREIDESLSPSDRPGYAAQSSDGAVKVLVPTDSAKTPVRLEDQRGGWVSFRMVGLRGAPNLGEKSATFADGPPGAAVRYDSITSGVKETITLSEAPAEAPVYTFDLRMSSDLGPRLTSDNELIVVDADGQERFQVPAPYMQDSSPAAATSAAIPMALAKAGPAWTLTMRPDQAWLTDSARVYPVVVDPTTVLSPATVTVKDTYMIEDESPVQTHNTEGWVRVGASAGSGTRRRTLLRFGFPTAAQVPTGATVTSATLSLYLASWLNTNTADYAVRAMNPVDATNGTTWEGSATWLGSGTGTPWTGATNFFQSAPQPNKTIGAGSGTRTWDVKTIVAGWVADRSTHNGLIIKGYTEPSSNELRFVSSEGGSASQKPSLSFDWITEPPTIPVNSLTVTPSTSTPTGVEAESLTPTLSANVSDPDSLTLTYKFQVLNESGAVVASTPVDADPTVDNTPGTPVPVSFQVPVGALTIGGRYTARLTVGDETTNPAATSELPFRVQDKPPVATADSLKVEGSVVAPDGRYARTLTPRLTAKGTDADTPSVGYKFEIRDGQGAVVASTNGTQANPTPGTPLDFAYDIPAGTLQEQVDYTAKFTITDATTTGGSSIELPFKVDVAPAITDPKVDPSTSGTTSVVDPELSALVTDPSGPLTARFEIQDTTAGTPVKQLESDDVDSGDRATITVSPDGPDALVPGHSYKFRVGAEDSVGASLSPAQTIWTDWATFTVSQDAQQLLPLQLAEATTVWAEGADLSWTPYRDPSSAPEDDLTAYHVYRCVAVGSGECAALVPQVPIAVVQSDVLEFRDRTATPSSSAGTSSYRYWIVAVTADSANNKESNARVTDMPLNGRVRRVFLGDLPDATISSAQPDTNFKGTLRAGKGDPTYGEQRALLDFDLSVINPGMEVTKASFEATRQSAGVGGTFALHPLNRSFVEGQVTWTKASVTDDWLSAGGDTATTAMGAATTTAETGPVSFANSASMRAAVQGWVDDRPSNHGLLIKATSTAGRLDLVPSESTVLDPATLTEKRPRLVVEHKTTSMLAAIAASKLPQRYVPNTDVTVPVTVTNTTDTDWPSDLKISYRWTDVGGTTDVLTSPAQDSRGVAIPALKAGESAKVDLTIRTPINSDSGNGQPRDYDLYLDLWKSGVGWYSSTGFTYYDEATMSPALKAERDALLADNACALLPTKGLSCPHRVAKDLTSSELGLEKFGTYAGEETGGGAQALVNLNTGNLVWSYDAMSSPSVGPSFFLRVAYNSEDAAFNTAHPNNAGFGWSVQPGTLSRLNEPLVDTGSGKTVELTDGDGTKHIWREKVGGGGYDSPAGIHLKLVKDASGYRFIRPDGTTFYFDATTRLPTKVVDVSGNTLQYVHVSGRLTEVIDKNQRKVAQLGYNGSGKIRWICDVSCDPAVNQNAVIDKRGLVFDYSTDNPEFLRGIRDGVFDQASGNVLDDDLTKTFRFEYSVEQANAHAVLTKVSDAALLHDTRFGYYDATTPTAQLNSTLNPTTNQTVPNRVLGQVRSLVDRAGRTTYFENYEAAELPSGMTMPGGAQRFARVLDQHGSAREVTSYGIDPHGRTIEVKDANANAGDSADTADDATRLGWDADHNVVRLEEPNTAVSRWIYDQATGFPRRMWDAEAVENGGPPRTMNYTTKPNGAVVLASIVSPLGHKTTFGHDDKGRLLSVTDPEDGTTSHAYNPDGTVASTTDPRGNTTSFSYPTDPAQNIGYPNMITPPTNGLVGGDTTPDVPTSFVYDPRGAVTKTTRTATIGGTATTLQTTAAYDVFGRVETMASPGAQGGSRTVSYSYDRNDNQTQVDAPNGATTSNTFNADDQVKTTTLPENGSGTRVVSFAYDGLGRLCREYAPKAAVTTPACASDTSPPPAYATDYRYDHVGQLESTTGVDDAGQSVVTSYFYDNVGNLQHVRDPRLNRAGSESFSTKVTYDRNHRAVATSDALGKTVRSTYDADGRVVRTTDQLGKPTRFTYDRAGRLLSTTVLYNSPSGLEEWTTRNEYDKAGNLVRMIRPRAVQHGTVSTELFSETRYDENNRPFRTLSAYDGSDAAALYQTPTSTYLRYDALGRLASQSAPVQTPVGADTAPAGAVWSSFTHYQSGEIASSVDPTGLTTRYEYDLLGKQTKRTLVGVNPDGSVSAKTRTMFWDYFPDGSLMSRTDWGSPAPALVTDNPGSAAGWTQVSPTGSGGRYGAGYLAHPAGGTEKVTWDVTPSASGEYSVEVACPKPSAGEPAGARSGNVSYTLTSGATSTTLTGDQTGCDSLKWRPIGSPGQTVTLDPGTKATLSVTPSGSGVTVADAVRLVPADNTTGGRGFAYAYDENGQQTSVTNTGAGVRASSWATAYDVLGRAKSVKELAADSGVLRQTSYTYDVNSNPLSVTASRVAQDAGGGGEDRGNLAVASKTSYVWDARNLVASVTAVTSPGSTAPTAGERTWTYEWDARGLLERLTKPGATSGSSGNVVSLGYFDNGLLRSKVERKPDAGAADAVVASHLLSYNADGDPVRDITRVANLKEGAPAGGMLSRTLTYEYSPTQQLLEVDKQGTGAGKRESYAYDEVGNTVRSQVGDQVTDYTYVNDRLSWTKAYHEDDPGQSVRMDHVYDEFGRLSEVNPADSTLPGVEATSYTYDGFDRIVAEARGETVTSTRFDPFDRPTVRTVEKAGDSSRTRFNYLGTSKQVAAEERTDASHPWQVTKTYAYGPDGKPLALTSTPLDGTAAKTRYYSTNTHGDVEALTDPAGGAATATYRYTAYGDADKSGTWGEDKPEPDGAEEDPTKDVLNPYRYSSKRIDPASGNYDMGFRTYDPGLNAFLSRDMYNGALSDIQLGLDPWNANRYAFAGGNPITRVELDGHYNLDSVGGAADPTACHSIDCARAANGPMQPANSEPADEPSTADRVGGWLKDKTVSTGKGFVGTFTSASGYRDASAGVFKMLGTTADAANCTTLTAFIACKHDLGSRSADKLNSFIGADTSSDEYTYGQVSALIGLTVATGGSGAAAKGGSFFTRLFGSRAAAKAADEVPAFARSQYSRMSTSQRAGALAKSPMCPYCGTRPSTQGDHISSLKRDWASGGWADDRITRSTRVNSSDNLIGACQPCNGSKGALDIGPGAGQWWPPGWPSGVWWPFGGP
jgi:RHS repeat-associated protein